MADAKILCFSDSHGRVLTMYDAVLAEKPDMIFHAGDSEDSFETLEELLRDKKLEIECHAVLGNCDKDNGRLPYMDLITLNGRRFLLIHSHQFPELRHNGDYREAVTLAEKNRADVLVFGHTHNQERRIIDRLLCINPGAAEWGHYAVIEVTEDGEISARLLRE